MTRREKLANQMYAIIRKEFDDEFFKQDEKLNGILLTVSRKLGPFLDKNAQFISDRNFERQRRLYHRPLKRFR